MGKRGLIRRLCGPPSRFGVETVVIICAATAIGTLPGGAEDKPTKPADSCLKGDPATGVEALAVVSDYTVSPPVVQIDNGFDKEFDKDLDGFNEDEVAIPVKDASGKVVKKGGLGPTYNGTSCGRCHLNPVAGGSSAVSELRAGHLRADPADPSPKKLRFVEPIGGSVIQQQAIDPAIQKSVLPEDNVRTLRMSNSILGNGFVEMIPDCDILEYRKTVQKKHNMEGFVLMTKVAMPDPNKKGNFVHHSRIGRFGWKSQEASLMNFAAGAYVTEMGITSPLFPDEVQSNIPGKDVAKYDRVPDPEDKPEADAPFGDDVTGFAKFMRSLRVPGRDAALAATADAKAGEELFGTPTNTAVGCAICHRPSYTTPPAGTPILTLHGVKGSDLDAVPPELGNKTIHPYSDFLLHDVGTGDGIVQTFHASQPPKGYDATDHLPKEVHDQYDLPKIEATKRADGRRVLYATSPSGRDEQAADKMRTAPLWGLRTRPQLMHDGLSLTIEDAILRHKGQADGVRLKYEGLTPAQKQQLLTFLKSL